jgi:cell division transport system permease protein
MSRNKDKVTIRQLRSSNFTSIVSISLVLFLFGLVGLLVLNSKKLSDYVKENIGFTVILNENIKQADIIRLQKELDANKYVKSTEFINKDKAAIELQKDIGEDFINFLGYNPLLASIDVRLKAEYATTDFIKNIENEFKNYPQVKEIFYQKSLIHLVNENIRKISLVILVFCILLFFISLALINNTIRLSIYSKRFIINTMKLVGATRGFIRIPFIIKSIINGFIGSVVAIVLLMLVIYISQNELGEIISLQDNKLLIILFLVVILVGIFFTFISTFFAINRYLRIKTDDLYLL